MHKNELMKSGDKIFRILAVEKDEVLIIDCIHKSMPKWVEKNKVEDYEKCTEQELYATTGKIKNEYDSLPPTSRRFVHEHFTLIAGILPFIGNSRMRCNMITNISVEKGVSKQTIRHYLWLYLVYQDIAVFVPKKKCDRPLTTDEKNMRYALNKYFYTRRKNSLNTAYTMMLKEKYCKSSGLLLPAYPSFNQFKYFYRKYNKKQTYYIAREGLKKYQRDYRPLVC